MSDTSTPAQTAEGGQHEPDILAIYEESIDDLKERVVRLQATRHMEAPASANFRLSSEGGVEIQFTLRDDDETTLLTRLGHFMGGLHALKFIFPSSPAKSGTAPTSAAPSTAVHQPTAPVNNPAPVAPAAHANGKPVQTLTVNKIDVAPRADGKVDIKFWTTGRKFPDLNAVMSPEKVAEFLQPTGGWTPEHFMSAATYEGLHLLIDWRESDRVNSKGNPYRDIVAARPG